MNSPNDFSSNGRACGAALFSSRRRSRLRVVLAVAWLLAPSDCLWADGAAELPTVAEQSGFAATSRSAEVAQYIDQLTGRGTHLRRLDFGQSVEGRPLVAVVAARPELPLPLARPDNDQRLIVLLLGNVHAGECDGKEALLMLLRDVALNPQHPWLEHAVLVFVPNFNTDANDRQGPSHRPGQDGPTQGMGQRENAQGLDLNRDFVKLETPEVRALVSLIERWNPELSIDTHTTNGSRHRYALTYDHPHNPASPPGPREFLRGELLPAVTARLQQQNLATFFYGNFNDEHTTWSTYGHEPRYGIEYLGLRGRLAILAESYSYQPFEQRIRATKAFVAACLDEITSRRDKVRELLSAAEKQVVDAGARPASGDNVPLRSQPAAWPDKVTILGYERQSGTKQPQPSDKPKDYTVEYLGQYKPTHAVPRPFAYLIPWEQSRVVDRLRMHGVRLETLSADLLLDVEVARTDTVRRAPGEFNGHRLVTAQATRRTEKRTIPAKTYVVRTAQRLGTLATCLLEPESDDGLATWNFFDHSWTDKEDFPVLRLPAAAELKTQPVERVVPAQRLDLDQLYGPSRIVPFGGSLGGGFEWLPKSSQYLQRRDRSAFRVDAESGAAEPHDLTNQLAAALRKVAGISVGDAQRMAARPQWSSDRSAALFESARDLFYLRLNEELLPRRLTNTPQPEENVTFSPDGRLVAFVRDHNLFVLDVATGVERPLTTDGSDKRLNGILDWVYQEELYGRGEFRGYWWSPDSQRIAFLQLDEQPVHRYTVADGIPYRQELEVTPYPKAGDPLPSVRLAITDAAGGEPRWVDHYEYSTTDLLIARVDWSDDSRQLTYQAQNRAQTWLDLRAADPDSGASRRLVREQTDAWVSVLAPPHWLKDGAFLWLSERTGNKHVYRISADGQQVSAVTSGNWDVMELHGIDPDQRWVYFTAAKDSALREHGYRVHLDGSQLTRLTDDDGFHSVRFNSTYSHFVDTSSRIHRPPQTRLFRSDGTYLRTLQPNRVDYLDYYELNQPEFLQVPARDGLLLDAMLIKPPGFDPQRKYPVLVYVYSGPQAPVVADRWTSTQYLWHQLLAQRGYCIWLCDNRLATRRGARLAWTSYKRLGQEELKDIEDGLSWLKKQSWVDAQRIGIHGWSYGGYMTSYALTHSQTFKLGIAGAPVTDWRNYDAIYTERYMGLPQENPQGYSISSVVAAADKLHGRLLLIHGTQDDNVHLGNSLQLVYALQKAGKQFELMVYPKSRHGVGDPQLNRHLRELMTRFVLDNL